MKGSVNGGEFNMECEVVNMEGEFNNGARSRKYGGEFNNGA
jgi:hypothetical protein